MNDLHTPFHRAEVTLVAGTLLPLAPEPAGLIAGLLVSMDPWKRLGYRESGLLAYLTRPDRALARYCIVCGEGPAGVVCIRYPWLRGPSLELLAVLDGFQDKGLGSAVLEWMEKEARETCPNLWTVVSAFNLRAIAFYEKHGFREVVILRDFLMRGEDEILLRKPVGSVQGDSELT